ncbi:Testis-specific serine/threonine-protein kinase 1 [Halotydeus destructor]|nr:Testis-specific serine/threonine-protein kinase 1 [Halotydeus destructor]
MSNVIDLDTVEDSRIDWENQQVAKVLARYSGNRSELRRKLNEVRTSNWQKVLKTLPGLPIIEKVLTESAIESTGRLKILPNVLATGQFSKVLKAVDQKSGNDLAVKVISADSWAAAFKIKSKERHFKLLSKLRHPFLMNPIKVYEVSSSNKLYVFMPVATLGSIEALMKSNHAKLDEELTKTFALDIGRGLSYLHFLGVAHRRVNPSHVLVTNLDGHAKLSMADCCFEIANHENGEKTKCRTVGVPDAFSAPECVFGTSFDPFPVDIWAFGCTVFYMLNARAPFDNWNEKKAMKEQLDSKKWSKSEFLTQDTRNFLMAVIHGSIDKRPCIAEILALPWLRP